MAVQCRMFVKSVKQTSHSPESREVELSVITRGDEAKEWSKYTPSATMTMWITNPDAHEQFGVGREFLLTFQDVTP